MASSNAPFGVDIGGTGIKGAPVDLDKGALGAERFRIPTPQPAEPEPVADVVRQLVEHFGHTGRIGATFPAVIKDGTAMTAANVAKAWIGTDVAGTLSSATGLDVVVLNDADAAGLAEARYGAARDHQGVVVVATLGTGIGSALLFRGELIPNTELGHLEIDGHDAETRASDGARERDDLSWEHWAKRVSRYLQTVENLFWPDLIVLGGGVSKKADKWLPMIKKVRTPLVPAALQNEAGIIGAAIFAEEQPQNAKRAPRKRG